MRWKRTPGDCAGRGPNAYARVTATWSVAGLAQTSARWAAALGSPFKNKFLPAVWRQARAAQRLASRAVSLRRPSAFCREAVRMRASQSSLPRCVIALGVGCVMVDTDSRLPARVRILNAWNTLQGCKCCAILLQKAVMRRNCSQAVPQNVRQLWGGELTPVALSSRGLGSFSCHSRRGALGITP